jgi:hypothetical protein
MVQLIMVGFLISISVVAASLYSDDVQNLDQPMLRSTESSTKKSSLQENTKSLVHQYTSLIFNLSQLTHDLSHITDESIIYSDINRLTQIFNEIKKGLNIDDFSTNYSKKNTGSLSQMQRMYQEIIFKFYAITPYINDGIKKKHDQTKPYIEYLSKITQQIEQNIANMVALKQQLNLGDSSPLPFSPQSPRDLSFALENQLNTSLFSMFQTNDTNNNDMPYSSFATPANANFLMQGTGQISTSNAAPLHLMNYFPMF